MAPRPPLHPPAAATTTPNQMLSSPPTPVHAAVPSSQLPVSSNPIPNPRLLLPDDRRSMLTLPPPLLAPSPPSIVTITGCGPHKHESAALIVRSPLTGATWTASKVCCQVIVVNHWIDPPLLNGCRIWLTCGLPMSPPLSSTNETVASSPSAWVLPPPKPRGSVEKVMGLAWPCPDHRQSPPVLVIGSWPQVLISVVPPLPPCMPLHPSRSSLR
jgi:hypothetical protein